MGWGVGEWLGEKFPGETAKARGDSEAGQGWDRHDSAVLGRLAIVCVCSFSL